MQKPALQVRDLSRQYGALRVLDEVSFTVQPGERRAIIGPNGAGKTTLFKCVGGEVRPTSGTIQLHGHPIAGLPSDRIARLGLARTFQRNNLFLGLSVFANVSLARQRCAHITHHLFRPLARFVAVQQQTADLLQRVGLWEQRETLAGNLSYGEQRQLELGIALATDPTVLLLDEPTAGMSQAETNAMTALLATLPPDLTILIIEHDMDVVFALAQHITVLHYGQVLAEGTPPEIKANPRVQEVYLGDPNTLMTEQNDFQGISS
jgi:branched-chain amino acid transport system ATP-binding protein